MSRLRHSLTGTVILGAALYVGFRPVGAIPPLGAFLDPANGVWALAANAEHRALASAAIPSLTAPVDVRYDDRGVPHIFAHNELDAIRALGYAVATDRLFQLELQTRAAAGTLSELVGARAIEVDRTARRSGLPWGAHRKFAAVPRESMAMRAMEAYADGVNAYIDHMRPADLPFEYRLLHRTPQRWQAEHTMLLLVQMGYTLAWSDFEMDRANVEARIGRDATDALFPRNAYVQEPIQPNGQRAPRFDAMHLPPPKPDSVAAALAKVLAAAGPGAKPFDFAMRREDVPPGSIGSNNWAVAPARSASAHALLANDPHLDLSLPSIWYEAHLVVADSLDVYGVTFPGAPGITLGFTRDVAWGATNTGADVADYYIEAVDDTVAPKKYRVDGTWRDVRRVEEPYLGPHGTVIATDTLYYGHRGPLFRVGNLWISRRWLVLEPSSEFDTFRRATHAHSVSEYFDLMNTYVAPAQNFVAADRQGHIGIQTTGDFPVRRDGSRLLDGTSSANDWARRPTRPAALRTIDPKQGYVASANQQPTDPRVFPDYLGFDWENPWRAMRINGLLRADSAVTPQEMRLFQTDPGSARADAFVPLFLAAARAESVAGRGSAELTRAETLLAEWDRRYTTDNTRAVLFEGAMRELARNTWDELAADSSTSGSDAFRLIATPSDATLYALTQDPSNVWWDRVRTPLRETRDMILATSLSAALVQVERDRGAPDSGKWRWSRVRFANIWHPLHLEALSALELSVQGGRETLSPSSGSGVHGASWRLVTEMGPSVRAWGIYPGGQSANPVSSHYRDHIETWRRGELDSLRFPARPEDLGVLHLAATLTLTPVKP